MTLPNNSPETQAQGWRTLTAAHSLIEGILEKALAEKHKLSVVEYTVLDVLNRQDGWHIRMQQLSRATALSKSATTRLVNRLENRGLLARYLCTEDRRGIYSELTPTGKTVLKQATPNYNKALKIALEEAKKTPELLPVIQAIENIN